MKFRYAIYFLPIFLLLSASTFLQSENEDTLRALLDDFLAGASVNDYEMHDRFWADDLIYTGSNGERITKSDIMAGLTPGNSASTREPLTLYYAEEVQINVYENSAVVAFRLVAEIPLESGETDILNFYNTGTFVLRDGEWRAVAWQATRTIAG